MSNISSPIKSTHNLNMGNKWQPCYCWASADHDIAGIDYSPVPLSRRESLALDESVPEVRYTAAKAIAAAIGSGVVAAIAVLAPASMDGVVDFTDILWTIGAFITGSGLTGLATYAIPNKPIYS